jgi:hypothetical protein
LLFELMLRDFFKGIVKYWFGLVDDDDFAIAEEVTFIVL